MPNMKLKFPIQKILIFAIIFVFILSLFPRLFDIMKFLPNYSIDENDIVEFAIGYWGGDLDPHWYKYGPLYSYILSAIYYIISLFYSGDLQSFAQDIFFDNTRFYYIARFINSCVNIALAYFSFKIAKKFISEKAALWTLLIAIFPFFDLLVNFKIRIDSLLALWTIVLLYYILMIQKTGKTKYYFFSAIFLGLGMATKPIPSLLVLPTFFLAHFWAPIPAKKVLTKQQHKKLQKLGKEKMNPADINNSFVNQFLKASFNWKLLLFLIFGIATNFIFNPYSIINNHRYLAEQKQAVLSEGSRNFTPGWDVSRFFDSLGEIFIVASILGALFFLYQGIKTKNKIFIVLISYPAIFWLAFAKGAARDYFYVPMLPPLIIALGYSIQWISEIFDKKSIFKYTLPLLLVLIIMAKPAINLTLQTINLNNGNYKEQHSEIASKKWIEENIPKDANILLYGEYTSMPRIVSSEITDYGKFSKETKTTSFLGQYFMYGRWAVKYFRDQFLLAHRNYIKEGKPYFTNIEYYRVGNSKLDENIFNYILNKKTEFVISNLDFDKYAYFNSHTLKRFDNNSGYPFGGKICIYKISAKDTSDLCKNPVLAEDYYMNAFLNMRIKNNNKALSDFNKCIEKGLNNPNAFFYRGIFRFQNSEYKLAIEDFDKTTDANPKFSQAYYNKGVSYLRLNNKELACYNLNKADSLGYKGAKSLLDRFCK